MARGRGAHRYEWGPGTLIVPPNMWYHQHFNTGTEPARYLAFKHEVVSIRNAQGVPKAWISQRIGGDQIDYADESSYVRETFKEALAKNGLEPQMETAYEQEQEALPPKPDCPIPLIHPDVRSALRWRAARRSRSCS